MKRVIAWEKLMERISTVEKIEENRKLKRMHLFLTPEDIAKADSILMRAKQQTIDSDDSASIDSKMMDRISEMSHFDKNEF